MIEGVTAELACERPGQDGAWSKQGWVAVGRGRPLYVPRAGAWVRRYGIEFFVWRRWQRCVCRGVAAGGMLVGSKDPLPQTEALAEIQAKLVEAWPVQDDHHGLLHLFLREGSEGPLKKLSVLAVGSSGRQAVFAKVAQGAAASVMVDREAHTLTLLAQTAALRPFVPQLLAQGKLSNGRSYILTTVAASFGSGAQFDERHLQFLAALWHATVQRGPLLEAPQAHRLREQRRLCDAYLPADVKVLVDRCLALKEELLSGVDGLSVLVHRDFAPWNIKGESNRIHVFDWEYAELGGSPLHDMLHFALAPLALRSKGTLPLATAAHGTRAAVKAVQSVFPQSAWPDQVIRGSLLSYLLDTLLFYVVSDGGYQDDHPVLRTFRAWLEELCIQPDRLRLA